MTSKKAIEIQTEHVKISKLDYLADVWEAMRLGLEALKLYDHNRHIGKHIDPGLLPGETKE